MRFPLFAALALLASLPAFPARADGDVTFKTFSDKGEVYVRAGTNEGFHKGTVVVIENARHQKVGTAVVLDVWPSMAHLVLDEQASRGGPNLYVSLVRHAPAETRTLQGHASLVGFGPFKTLHVTNETPYTWTHCDVRLPDNRHELLDQLTPGDSNTMNLGGFTQDGVARDLPLTSVRVTCAEGAGSFGL